MPFQQQVKQYLDIGFAGQVGTLNPCTYFPKNPLASDAGVTIGKACFYDATDENVSNVKGENHLAGISVRLMDYVNYDILSEGSMLIRGGQAVTILAKGDIFVEAKSAASFGQYVYASTLDGSLSFGSSATAPANTVLTSFKAAGSASIGENVLISSLGV